MNRQNIRRLQISQFLLVACIAINAQVKDTLYLNLSLAIKTALQQSPTAQSARHTFLVQHWNYRNHCANYLPSITLESSPYINHRINKITQGDGTSRFLQQSQFGGDLTMNINQNIGLTGGTLFLRSEISYLREMENKNDMYSSIPVSIGYSQSLFGYNSLKWDRRIEPLRYSEAKKSYAETIELISAQTCNHFFNLAYAQSNVEMANSNFIEADKLYTMAQGRYKIGTITENEMLQLEIRRMSEESNVMNAKIAEDEELNKFRSFLGLSQDIPIQLILPDSIPQFEVPFNEVMELAIKNSPDPLYYERILLESRSNTAYTKANSGLKADIYLQFGLSQTGNTPTKAYTQPLHQEYGNITISIPILDWGRRRGKLRVARSQQKLTEIQAEQGMEDFRQNIKKIVSQFNMQGRKVHIAKLTDERSHQRHNVAMKLYIMGQNTLLDLNAAVSERNSAHISYLNAMSTYWSLYYTLRSITGYDFQNRCEITENLPVE